MLKSLFWIGATGIALIAGIAYHYGDDIHVAIEHSGSIEALAGNLEHIGDEFDREFDEAEEAIESGADRKASYEDALSSALIGSGIFTLDNIDDIEISEDERQLLMDGDVDVQIDIDDVIEQAKAKLEAARERGDTPVRSLDIDGDDINDLLETLEELDAFNDHIRVRTQ